MARKGQDRRRRRTAFLREARRWAWAPGIVPVARGARERAGALTLAGERPERARNQLLALKEAHQPSALTE
ncbi:MAG: hypothetical protein HIU85_18085 [Proteobacteria bacterium]|nr:hypothetical protein [Pseudomonadota bacterium]